MAAAASNNELAGQVAIITGGAQGLGYAIADRVVAGLARALRQPNNSSIRPSPCCSNAILSSATVVGNRGGLECAVPVGASISNYDKLPTVDPITK